MYLVEVDLVVVNRQEIQVWGDIEYCKPSLVVTQPVTQGWCRIHSYQFYLAISC